MTKYSNFIAIGQVFCYNGHNMANKRTKSFTLIEMLLVVVIIGILSSILIFNSQDAFDEEKKMKLLSSAESLKGRNQESLVSEWIFEGPTLAGLPATVNDVKDTWGYNNGTVAGGAIVRDGDYCISGKCLSLDGVDDHVSFGTNTMSFPGSSFTFSAWVYLRGYRSQGSVYNSIVGWGSLSNSGWGVVGNNTNTGIVFGVANEFVSITVPNLLNNWHYVVAVQNVANNTAKVYVDGVSSSVKNTTLEVSGTNTLYLGRDSGTNRYGNEMIDDVRIYKAALSFSQVRQQYVAGLDSLLTKNLISQEDYNDKMINLATNE